MPLNEQAVRQFAQFMREMRRSGGFDDDEQRDAYTRALRARAPGTLREPGIAGDGRDSLGTTDERGGRRRAREDDPAGGSDREHRRAGDRGADETRRGFDSLERQGREERRGADEREGKQTRALRKGIEDEGEASRRSGEKATTEQTRELKRALALIEKRIDALQFSNERHAGILERLLERMPDGIKGGIAHGLEHDRPMREANARGIKNQLWMERVTGRG
jgi:polyhydroxyalkanoate synthesis regulator phasin